MAGTSGRVLPATPPPVTSAEGPYETARAPGLPGPAVGGGDDAGVAPTGGRATSVENLARDEGSYASYGPDEGSLRETSPARDDDAEDAPTVVEIVNDGEVPDTTAGRNGAGA